MSENNNMVKKEFVLYALFIGLVAGFLAGTVFSVFKLNPETTAPVTVTKNTSTPQQQNTQLDGQMSEAIRNLEAEVTNHPGNVEAWTRLGHLYYDTDQIKNAINAYSRSLELQPGNPDVLTDQGVMYRRDNQHEKAVEAFTRAFTLQPEHIQSRLNAGIVLFYDLHKHEEGIAAWEQALTINPDAKMNNGMPLKDAIVQLRAELVQDNQQAQ